MPHYSILRLCGGWRKEKITNLFHSVPNVVKWYFDQQSKTYTRKIISINFKTKNNKKYGTYKTYKGIQIKPNKAISHLEKHKWYASTDWPKIHLGVKIWQILSHIFYPTMSQHKITRFINNDKKKPRYCENLSESILKKKHIYQAFKVTKEQL